jgi:thioredoxin reductase (NADPH)
MQDKVYDILIIGAGPAGMSAAIYAGRSDKTVAIFDRDGFGGNIAKSPKVENLPGFVSISGADFAANMFQQMTNLPTVEHFIENILYVDYRYGLFRIRTDANEMFCGRSLIFATGTKHKELTLDTPDIYYCATCDGPFFKNKNVIVVGSGNSGATYALELASYCKNVFLCDVTMNMCCEAVLQKQIAETPNIHWLPNSTVVGVTNGKDGHLSSVKLTTGDTIKCSAIFAAIGLLPQTDIVKPFARLNQAGYIISPDCITTAGIPGVYAAGDCRESKVKQAVTAAADGATAAIEAIKYLKTIK